MPPTRAPGPPAAFPADLDPRARRPGSGRGPTPGSVRVRRRRTFSRFVKGLLLVLAAVTAGAVLVVSFTGWTVLQWSGKSIARVDAFAGLTGRPAPSADGSTTFLLVGSDARAQMTTEQMKALHVGGSRTAVEGRRADTMLLMHVSPRHGTVTVVSLPRDSYVTIPAHRSASGSEVRESRNKLNAAYSWGGPALTVATVERTTHVRVDHYVEVDFLGFVKLVDSVGGVDVCSPTRLRDAKAGLRLPAGVSHLDGRTGLAYVRARHIDARADLGRIDRQQAFLASMAARVTSRDVLLDPRAVVRFLSAALDSVRADPGLSESALVDLATQLRHAHGKDVRFTTVPIANPSYRARGAGAVALWDQTGAAALFTSMREDSGPARKGSASSTRAALSVPPDQIRVQVYNGSTTVGLASKASSELAAHGFVVAGPAQNWRTNSVGRTTLRYDSRYSESIKTLAAAVPGARLQAVPGLGRTLQVVVGSTYGGTRAVHVAGSPTGTGVTRSNERTAADDPCT